MKLKQLNLKKSESGTKRRLIFEKKKRLRFEQGGHKKWGKKTLKLGQGGD